MRELFRTSHPALHSRASSGTLQTLALHTFIGHGPTKSEDPKRPERVCRLRLSKLAALAPTSSGERL
eukprot:34890-Alexandrium_andersonii.AAC.1